MPKKQILGMVLIIVLLSFVCSFIYDKYKDQKNETEIIEEKQETIIGEKLGNSLKLYYTDIAGSNYYLYGLDKVTVDYGDRTLELDRALEAKQISISFMINYIGVDNQILFKDGGSTLIHNNKLALLQCHTIEGNHDYYFGPSNMKYEEGFCKDDAYICSFTKTYQVLNIIPSNDNKYVYLTLRGFQKEEVETVKVVKKLTDDITENEFYEFKFAYLGNSKDESMKSLFENNNIISINHTTKQGLEQINEKICK